jgi:hypothetical protein
MFAFIMWVCLHVCNVCIMYVCKYAGILYNVVCMYVMYYYVLCMPVCIQYIHIPSQIKGEEAVSAGKFHAMKTCG